MDAFWSVAEAVVAGVRAGKTAEQDRARHLGYLLRDSKMKAQLVLAQVVVSVFAVFLKASPTTHACNGIGTFGDMLSCALGF